ncbi:MAG: RsmE family RNA methyltransferase [Sphingobacteriaceae bacterium]|nr:RsmE family RNA methyltransferase [Sphingobacteriaceae bacterium]
MEYYYQEQLPESGRFLLEVDEAFHAVKTRRRKVGDHIHLTNGKGAVAEVKLTQADARKCEVEMLHYTIEKPFEPLFKLAVSPLKQEARFEWLIEKAVEMGVSDIIPLQCERTEKVHLKFPRLERLMIAAMKQSLKAFLPRLHPVTSFKTLSAGFDQQHFLAHCLPSPKTLLLPSNIHSGATLLIGPEGDFSETEIETALKLGVQAISLGEARLRTETAALVALGQAHHAYQIKNRND